MVTEEVATLIIESLIRSSDHIRKIAFVGGSKRASKTLRSFSKELNLSSKSDYFSSMDEAKNWLTREWTIR